MIARSLPGVVPHHGTILRVSADGSRTDIFCNGFRAANGVGLLPDWIAVTFKLVGDGALTRADDHVRVLLTLRGALPCGALAGAALTTRLGKTAIFVTHDVREALILARRIGLMHKGKLLLLETPEKFRASDHPQVRAYLETLELKGGDR